MSNSNKNLFDDEPILKSSTPAKPTEKVGFFKGISLWWKGQKEKSRQKKSTRKNTGR